MNMTEFRGSEERKFIAVSEMSGNDPDDCPLCDGKTEPEVNAGYREWICQDCGRVSGYEKVAEYEEAVEKQGQVDEV